MQVALIPSLNLVVRFVDQCLPPNLNLRIDQLAWGSKTMSQEDNIRRFIGIYESVVPLARGELQVSSFETLSLEELGAYSLAIISIHDMAGGFLDPPSQGSNPLPSNPEPVVKSLTSGVTYAPPTVRNDLVPRPLPACPLTSVDPPFYSESASVNPDRPQALDDISTGFAAHVISQLPEEERLLYRQLLSVIRNEDCCRSLLQGKGEAQQLLDLLHHVSLIFT